MFFSMCTFIYFCVLLYKTMNKIVVCDFDFELIAKLIFLIDIPHRLLSIYLSIQWFCS